MRLNKKDNWAFIYNVRERKAGQNSLSQLD